MTEKTPKLDEELFKKFDDLPEEDKLEMKTAEFTRKAIRGLEILLKKDIDLDTPLDEVQKIAGDLRESLKRSLANEKIDSKKRIELSLMLQYMNIIYGVLENLRINEFDQDTRIGLVLEKLKEQLKKSKESEN